MPRAKKGHHEVNYNGRLECFVGLSSYFFMDGKTDNIQRFKVVKFYHVKKPETTKKV